MKRFHLSVLLIVGCSFSWMCAIAHADRLQVAHKSRTALGVAGGHLLMDDQRDGDDINAVAQFGLANALSAELELGMTEYHAGDRRDRRIGVGILTWLRPTHRWSPYLGLGIGRLVANMPLYDLDISQLYFEVGGGVAFQVHERISIAGDIRAGARFAYGDSLDKIKLTVELPVEQSERYVRGRIFVMVHF